MTIERAEGLCEMHCDQCRQASFGPEDDIMILKEDALRMGWRTFKADGQWQNACPSCVAEFAARERDQNGRLF